MPHSFRSLLATLTFALVITASASSGFASNNTHDQRIEVAFVLDTTGSMAELIDGAKRKIWSIANAIIDVNPDADVRMALIAYRDEGDDYVVKTVDMSSDIQGLYGSLVKLAADGGGDTPESVNEALNAAVRQLSWTKDETTKRIVFLVGDAPPHMDYDNAPQYPEVLKQAQEEAITVNAVQAGDDQETTRVWREIAQFGHGRYIAIPQDGGRISIVETPFDHDIIILQQQIDKTVIPYGSRTKQVDLRSKMETKAMAPAAVQADNSSYYSKKSGPKEVVTGGGDLVTDTKNGAQQLDLIEDHDLPENLRGKSNEEKQAILDRQIQDREKLEEAMSALVTKRDTYVVEQTENQRASGTESFDEVVKETLRQQLK